MDRYHRKIVVNHFNMILLAALLHFVAGIKAGESSRATPTPRSRGNCSAKVSDCGERLRDASAICRDVSPIRVPRRLMHAGFGRHFGGRVWNRVARDPAASTATASVAAAPDAWTTLFDGKTLANWTVTNYGGEGEVRVVDGHILLEFGEPITGLTYQGEFPVSDYEIRVQAMRTGGIDFFCGLTFPVGDTHCSFIAAGWAGAVVGLSCIDGKDASENETTKFMNFENDRWYRFRVRVTDDRIAAWIDEQQVIDLAIQGRKISIRPEVELSRPLGIAAWQSRAALRELQYRRLK